MPEDFIYRTADVLGLLDDLLGDRGGTWGGGWWDEFFADQARPIPFFTGRPDESLAEWCDRGLVAPGRVLELGWALVAVKRS